MALPMNEKKKWMQFLWCPLFLVFNLDIPAEIHFPANGADWIPESPVKLDLYRLCAAKKAHFPFDQKLIPRLY